MICALTVGNEAFSVTAKHNEIKQIILLKTKLLIMVLYGIDFTITFGRI